MQVGKLTRSDFVEEIEIFFPENKDVLIRLLFSYNSFICFLTAKIIITLSLPDNKSLSPSAFQLVPKSAHFQQNVDLC